MSLKDILGRIMKKKNRSWKTCATVPLRYQYSSHHISLWFFFLLQILNIFTSNFPSVFFSWVYNIYWSKNHTLFFPRWYFHPFNRNTAKFTPHTPFFPLLHLFYPFNFCFPLYHLYFLLILSHFLLISLPSFDIFSPKWHHPYSPRSIFQYIGTQLVFLHVLLILSLFQISPSPCLMTSVNIFPLTRVGRRGFSKILTFVSIWGVSAGISHSWIFIAIGGREHTEKYCFIYGWFPRIWEGGGGEGGYCQAQSEADHHSAQPAGRVFLLSDTHPSGSPGTASILTFVQCCGFSTTIPDPAYLEISQSDPICSNVLDEGELLPKVGIVQF